MDQEFAEQNLGPLREAGRCLTFGPNGDLPTNASDTWPDIIARFPTDWHPDMIVLWLGYTSMPAWVWSAPIPIVGLAPDWNLQWHSFRHLVPLCDAILTDIPGVERMRSVGWDHVVPANLYGLTKDHLEDVPVSDAKRDVDVVFVGNMHPSIHAVRLPLLARLGSLVDRHRIVITSCVFGEAYRKLLRRSKLAFNYSVRGECNLRALEAAAAGAVLLQEADNREVPQYLTPIVEYLPYTGADFETVVDRALSDPNRCNVIAARARSRASNYPFHLLLTKGLNGLDANLTRNRAESRSQRLRGIQLDARIWQRVNLAGVDSDPKLIEDCRAAGHHALGLLTLDPVEIETALRRATDSGNRVSAIALGDFLIGRDRVAGAVPLLRDVAADLMNRPLTNRELDTPPVAPGPYSEYRVAWERAGWSHAGEVAGRVGEQRAKTTLALWQCRLLLGEATDDVVDFYEAASLRPDLSVGRAALGCGLARSGRVHDAAPHLRAAVRGNPFDLSAARALANVLADTEAFTAARRLAAGRRLLHRAAPRFVPIENWFATQETDPVVQKNGAPIHEHWGMLVTPSTGNLAPVGDELASIIILCCNELKYTKLCIDSLVAHTRAPYEIILVDNGSTDGTGAYFDVLTANGTVPRFKTVRNPSNRGFATCVNQGVAVATGEWLVLLNNDTVVTPRWLDRLLDVAAAGWPGVGLVGPVSNYAPDPQYCYLGYADLSELDAYAKQHWDAYGRSTLETPRLTGFCLALHRHTARLLGPLDERYGLGLFEDDDWCARARSAGLRLRVAQGVYIHHFGSRTFAGLGIDTAAALAANLERFRAKWGDAEASRYRPPGALTRVSLTMIVRDEEANLPACLAGLGGLFYEIVVVDTGSSDRTRDIALGLGAKVFDVPWSDSFAAARNAALDRATGDYVFWLDADDRLDETNRKKLAAVFASLCGPHQAHVMKCHCAPSQPSESATVVDHVRLFPRRPEIRWEFRVHEQILPSVRRAGIAVSWADVRIEHIGYSDASVRRRKLERDTRLLQFELRDCPGHPFALFNLGSIYHETGDDMAALDCLAQSLAASDPRDSIVRKIYSLVAKSHSRLGNPTAARATVATGRRLYPNDAELLYLDAGLSQDAGEMARAVQLYEELITGADAAHFGSVDEHLRGAKGRRTLELLLRDLGHVHEATRPFSPTDAGSH